MNFIHICLVLSVLSFCHMSYVEAECCSHYLMPIGQDCRLGGWCCGCGSCNIFCCNCAGGCDKEFWTDNAYWTDKGIFNRDNCGHKKREVVNTSRNVSLTAGILFKEVDIDGNNAITMGEANSYLTNNTRFKKSTTFSIDHQLRKMDTNTDGIISPEEFDSSLKL